MKANKLKKLVSVAFAFCAAALYAELPDPLVWFKMDALNENGGVDSVGTVANKTLTLTGGITLVDDAEMGKVLEFAGGASDRGNFFCPPLSSRTISLWFWRDRTNGDLTGDYPYVFQDLSGSGLNYSKNGNSVALLQSGIDTVDGRAICRDSWHHVAITINTTVSPAAIKIFEDGVCVRSANASADLPVPTKDSAAFIGNLNGKMGRPFKGRMFDFRVYDTALTGAQVGEIAADGLAKRGPCLISHWPFETIADGKTPEVTGYGTAMTLGTGMSLANDGVYGKALRFYSSDAQGIGASSALPAVELYGHTWTCWIRRSSKAPELDAIRENPYPRFIALNQGTFVQLADSASINGRSVAVFANRNATSELTADAAYGLSDADVWGHLAVVVRVTDGTSSTVSARADVYLNGEKVASTNKDISYWNALTLASNTIYLGNTGIGNNRYFCGDMDDLRLYDCALSDDEVRRVYRGLAGISAGADCSVAAETAVLRGTVANGSGNGVSSGFAGRTFWTLVSAPQGGEAAVIGNPQAPETSVTLPVVGEYVFRLTISDLGVSKSDEVTVTRVAPESGNVPPTIVLDSEASVELPAKLELTATVTDGNEGPSAVRVCWTKKSGPGGVWFTPDNAAATTADFSAAGTYVLVCTADDGQDSASREITVTVTGSIDGSTIRNGLGRFWKLDGGDAGLTHGGDGPFAAWSFEDGVEGLAAHPLGHKTYFATGITAFPGEEGGTANTACQNDFITVSAWVYVDSNTTNAWFRGAVIGKRQTFALRLKEKKSGRWGTQYPGFAIYQQATGGSPVTRYFYPELTADQKDRWLHVCAVVDRKAGTAMEMWYDGVQQTAVDSEGAAGGRYNANGITIGGEPYAEQNTGNSAYTSDYNVNYPKNINQESPTAGQYYSNAFPGKIDNVGIWSRKLSGDEIRYLAAHPAMDVNRGASVTMAAPEKVEKRTASEAVVSAFADIPLESGKSLTYAWQVISPNAANASFDDPTKASPKLTVTKAGVYVVQVAVSDGERTVYSRVANVTCDRTGLTLIFR